MPCFVPDQFKDKRWHVIRATLLGGSPGGFEIAEWVNDEANGPTEGGHWVRWGRCGDFPSLCHAIYVGPFPDQKMLDEDHKLWTN
jgi:hypothetical protein